MKVLVAVVAFLAVSLAQDIVVIKKAAPKQGKRVQRQTSANNADQMVQNILQWLQGVYSTNNRKTRQGFSSREYLPPLNTEKPRPFQPITQTPVTYPPPEPPKQQPYPDYPTGPASPTYAPPSYPTVPPAQPSYPSGFPTQPTGYPAPSRPTPGFPTGGFPSTQAPPYPTSPKPGFPTGYPTQPPVTGYPPATRPTPGYPTGPTTGYTTDYPTTRYPVTGYPTYRPTQGPTTQRPITQYPTTTYPTQRPTQYPSTYPTQRPTTQYPTQRPTTQYPSPYPTQRPTTQYPTPYPTQRPTTPYPTPYPTQRPTTQYPTQRPTTQYPQTTYPTQRPTQQPTEYPTFPPGEEDKHPPHIHAIEVDCAKDMMTINLEFNREYNGVIYSKGHFNEPQCRYVNENSGQIKYSFTVNLNSCGTEFINAFDTEGQSYLENVLVLQNEPGIQEVWDSIRSVRCLWEGNLNKALSVGLTVGMLNQEVVTFSGDTAMTSLDIQVGRGPFAPPANGLIKIGETMTLVVTVTGDPGFDIQVKECKARDADNTNVVYLTDDNGCVLKPKLFGAFQKTRNTGNTGASIIAYAFFSAFKFPDEMDIQMECNIELCKTDCQVCPDPNQKFEPGKRRRRRRDVANETISGDPVTIGKTIRVYLPEDLVDESGRSQPAPLYTFDEGICMSKQSFVISSTILIVMLTTSSLISAKLWLKVQRVKH